MIISGGKISNAANATINADSDAIEKIFNRAALVRTSGGIFLSDILRGFKYSDPSNSEEFSTIELEGMFTYENWCKN